MHTQVGVGYQAFLDGNPEEFGAVRTILPDGLSVYIENAGEFMFPASAIISVQSEKVTFARAKLDAAVLAAIGRAHASEDPNL